MKSEWKVYSNVIGDEKQYIVGRQLDTSKPLHGGNVEYKSGYTTNKDVAHALAYSLNEREKNDGRT